MAQVWYLPNNCDEPVLISDRIAGPHVRSGKGVIIKDIRAWRAGRAPAPKPKTKPAYVPPLPIGVEPAAKETSKPAPTPVREKAPESVEEASVPEPEASTLEARAENAPSSPEPQEWSEVSYPDLQRACVDRGLTAVGKTDVLIARLQAYELNQE